MPRTQPLHFYEEILLLALRDREGTVSVGFPEQAVAGAVLAELLLAGRISVDPGKKPLVTVLDPAPFGDPVIDDGLAVLTGGKRRATLATWLGRLAGMRGLRTRVARGLCARGILKEDEDRVLFLFRRRIFPEVDPVPERRVVERLRRAIFDDHAPVDPRTAVLVSLAKATGLLTPTFGRKEVKARRKRIESIVEGEVAGRATGEVIAGIEAALMVCVLMPTMTG